MRYDLLGWLRQHAPQNRVRSWSPPRALVSVPRGLPSTLAMLTSTLAMLIPRSAPRFGPRTWAPRRDQLALLAGAVILTVVTATVATVVARRRAARRSGEIVRGAPLRRLRGLVVRLWNPMVMRLGLAGGARSPWGLIEHIGRVSGNVYRTPISPRAIEGGYEVPLPYGTDVQWARNVLAAGQARIQYHDTIVELEQPEIVEAQDAASIPDAVRATAQRHGYHYLRLHTVAEMPGDFARGPGHTAALTRGEVFPLPAEGAFDATFLAPAGVEVPVEPQMVVRTPVDQEAGPAS